MDHDTAIETDDLIIIANNLLYQLDKPETVQSLKDCDHAYFIGIYESMLGERLPGLKSPVRSTSDACYNIRRLIDTLASDLLDVDLTHLSAELIARGDHFQIANLLEILTSLMEVVLEQVHDESQQELLSGDEAVESDLSDEEDVGVDRSLPDGKTQTIDEIESGGQQVKVTGEERDLGIQTDNFMHEISNENCTYDVLPSAVNVKYTSDISADSLMNRNSTYVKESSMLLSSADDKGTNSTVELLEEADRIERISRNICKKPVDMIGTSSKKVDEIDVIENNEAGVNTSEVKTNIEKEIDTSRECDRSEERSWSKVLSNSSVFSDTEPVPKPKKKLKVEFHSDVDKDSRKQSEAESDIKKKSDDSVNELKVISNLLAEVDDDVKMNKKKVAAKRAHKSPAKPKLSEYPSVVDRKPSYGTLKSDKVFRNLAVKEFGQIDDMIEEDNKENEMHVKELKTVFKKHKNILKKESEHLKKCNEKKKSLSYSLKQIENPDQRCASRLAQIYSEKPKKSEKRSRKARKRSISCSPVARKKFKKPLDLEDNDILTVMEDQFPFIHLSPHTAKLMWQKQMQQVEKVQKDCRVRKDTKVEKKIKEASKKQEALTKILKKEIDCNARLKARKELIASKNLMKRKLREQRQASARARKYYDQFQVQNRQRQLKQRTKEERVFKRLFEDGLEIQKQRIKEIHKFAKDEQERSARTHENEIASLENFYQDQYTMLADSIHDERRKLKVQEKSQNQVLHKMRNQMRKRMETDIQRLQSDLATNEDDIHFRELDAENMRTSFLLSTYNDIQPYMR